MHIKIMIYGNDVNSYLIYKSAIMIIITNDDYNSKIIELKRIYEIFMF